MATESCLMFRGRSPEFKSQEHAGRWALLQRAPQHCSCSGGAQTAGSAMVTALQGFGSATGSDGQNGTRVLDPASPPAAPGIFEPGRGGAAGFQKDRWIFYFLLPQKLKIKEEKIRGRGKVVQVFSLEKFFYFLSSCQPFSAHLGDIFLLPLQYKATNTLPSTNWDSHAVSWFQELWLKKTPSTPNNTILIWKVRSAKDTNRAEMWIWSAKYL